MSPDQAEWRAEDVEEAGLQVCGRPAQAFWLVLRPTFRRVLMEPHRRTGTGTVGWKWTDARTPSVPSGADLRELRERLGRALDEFAAQLTWRDEGGADDRSAELHQGMAGMVRSLMEAGDERLAAHAVRTREGWMIRSWGFPRPANATSAGEDVTIAKSPAPGVGEASPSTARRRRRWPWLILLAGVGAGLVGVVLFWANRSPESPPADIPAPAAAQPRAAPLRDVQAKAARAVQHSADSMGGAGAGGGFSLSGGTRPRAGGRLSEVGEARGVFSPGHPLSSPSAGLAIGPMDVSAIGPASTGEAGVGVALFADAPDARDGPADATAPERAPVVPGQMPGLEDPGLGGGAQPDLPGAAADGNGGEADSLGASDSSHASTSDAKTLTPPHPSLPAGVLSMPIAKRVAKITPSPSTLIAVPEESPLPTPFGVSGASSAPAESSGAVAKKKKQTAAPAANPTPSRAASDAETSLPDPAFGVPPARTLVEAVPVRSSLRKKTAKSKNPHAHAGDAASETGGDPSAQTGESAEPHTADPATAEDRAQPDAKEEDDPAPEVGAPGAPGALGVSATTQDAPDNARPKVTFSCVIGQWHVHPVRDVVLSTWPTLHGAEPTLAKARSQAWTQTKGTQPLAFRAPVTRGGWSFRLAAAAAGRSAPTWRDAVTGLPLPDGKMEGADARLSWAGLVPVAGIDARLIACDGHELARLTVAPDDRRIVIATGPEVVETVPWITVTLDTSATNADEMTWRNPSPGGSAARWETRRGRGETGVVCHPDPNNKTKTAVDDFELLDRASGWAMTCRFTAVSSDAPSR